MLEAEYVGVIPVAAQGNHGQRDNGGQDNNPLATA